ncbi:MAG: hypothetical protein IJ619_11515 [Eubacterium sp.]|nr:hypothetical protein [Eubacterium sp.]
MGTENMNTSDERPRKRPRPEGDRTPRTTTGDRPRRPRPDGERIRPDGERPRRPRPEGDRVRPDGERPRRPRPDGERVRPDGERPRRPRPEGDRVRPDGDRPRRPRPEGDRVRPDGDRPRRPRPEGSRTLRADSELNIRTDAARPRRPRPEGEVRRTAPADRPRRQRPDADRPVRSGGRQRKKPNYFLRILAGYTILLLILAGIFLVYADICIHRFEKSQSNYAIEDYIKDFQKSISKKKLPEGFAAEEANTFEDPNIKLNALIAQADGKELTYEKNSKSYNTEEPIYDILADGNPLARVTLSAYNSRTVFGILTIMDWKVKSAELLNLPDLTDYTIWVPEGYSIKVNGIDVSDEFLTGNESDQKLFENAKEYVSFPKLVEYKIPSLANEPEVSIADASGSSVSYNHEGTNYEVVFGQESEIPSDLKETALNAAETWSLFNTADLSGGSHGLDTVRAFLIPDSYYDSLAKQWAGGIDITFTSPHTLNSPAFENVNVTQYRRYTDDCFSVRISFDKPMHLTRTGETIIDSTDSEYLFVNHDGKWCMVDMVAVTNNAGDSDE